MIADDFGTDVPRRVDDDRARFGITVLRIEASQAHRMAVFAFIGTAGQICAFRSGVGPWSVRESLDPAAVLGIGSTSMGDQEGRVRAVLEIDDVEAGVTRRFREIDNPDTIAMHDMTALAVERGPRAIQQQLRNAVFAWRCPNAGRRRKRHSCSAEREEFATGRIVHWIDICAPTGSYTTSRCAGLSSRR